MDTSRFVLLLLSIASAFRIASASHAPGLPAPGLPVFTVTAQTNYDLGFAVGVRFKDTIAAAIAVSGAKELLRNHPKEVATYIKSATDAFPHIVDELRGTADGAGLPFDLVAANCFSDELDALSSRSDRGHADSMLADACSDFMYSNGVQAVVAHNEDGDPRNFNLSYFVNATIGDLSFMAFTYAGALSTNAFGYNSHGVYFSDNALFADTISTAPGVLPQSVIHRATMEQPSIDAVVKLLQTTPCASAFNYNLASAAEPGRLEGVEVAPLGRIGAAKLDGSEYCHFNEFRRIADAGKNDTSSEHRMARAKEVGHWGTVAGVRALLGDTKDRAWPIFRRAATDADGISTLASAVFDAAAATLSIYRANPKSSTPVYVFDVPRGD